MICGTHRKCSREQDPLGRTPHRVVVQRGLRVEVLGRRHPAQVTVDQSGHRPDEAQLGADLLIVADHHGPLGERQHRQREQVRLRRLVHDHHVEVCAAGELLDGPVHRHDPDRHGLDRRLHRALRVLLPRGRAPAGALADLAERGGPVGQRGPPPVVEAARHLQPRRRHDQLAGEPADLLPGLLHPPAQRRRIDAADHLVEPRLRPAPLPRPQAGVPRTPPAPRPPPPRPPTRAPLRRAGRETPGTAPRRAAAPCQPPHLGDRVVPAVQVGPRRGQSAATGHRVPHRGVRGGQLVQLEDRRAAVQQRPRSRPAGPRPAPAPPAVRARAAAPTARASAAGPSPATGRRRRAASRPTARGLPSRRPGRDGEPLDPLRPVSPRRRRACARRTQAVARSTSSTERSGSPSTRTSSATLYSPGCISRLSPLPARRTVAAPHPAGPAAASARRRAAPAP